MQLNVRGGKKLPAEGIERILIRGTNWIGDVVMTLPAVAAVRKAWPRAKISVLAKPWVTEVYRLSPDVDEIIVFQEPGRHAGIIGKLRLASELRQRRFDCAILLQNAIEAAIIARLAGIPLRAGYNADGRGVLLTHSVCRTKEIRRVHQIDYYIEMVRALGCEPAGRDVRLCPGPDYDDLAKTLFARFGIAENRPLIGIAPGAAYGPAKKWFPERFAAVADRLNDESGRQAILFGSAGDRESAAQVQENARHPLIDIAGKTNLKEAICLISRCAIFISNDSGLMHIAGALGAPTVAIFGSTNPATTSPVGKRSVVIHHDVPCGPCLKPVCPTDFRCMEMIGVEEVTAAALMLFNGLGRGLAGPLDIFRSEKSPMRSSRSPLPEPLVERQMGVDCGTRRRPLMEEEKGAAVFLDRDGTINEETGYLDRLEKLCLLPGVGEAIRRINESGLAVVVVTNQSGVARGLFDEAFVERVHARLREMLLAYGARIDAFYFCPHHPTEGRAKYLKSCDCRKPAPGMLLRAAEELRIDLSRSYMVGDTRKDIEAGYRAGAQGVLVRTGYGEESAAELGLEAAIVRPAYIAADLRAAVAWIMEDRKRTGL